MTRPSTTARPRTVLLALALGVVVFAVYNANGREVEVGDSIPSRLAAREFVLRGTFALDQPVKERPELAEWPQIVLGRDRHYRSAYSFVPPAEAAVLGSALHGAGVVDMSAPRAPFLVAKLTASLITALTCVLAFLTARRRTSDWQAACIALGLGLGTGLWPTVSQTLWQHETAIFGLMAAVWLLERKPGAPPPLWLFGLALGLAGMARAQVAPSIAILALAAFWRAPSWRSALGLWTLAACAIFAAALGMLWFGSPLGPRLAMLATMTQTHAVSGTIGREPWIGALGLLVSPNRGLLVFSPIVVVALAGFLRARRDDAREGSVAWYGAAALTQFLVYSAFSVWWAGYTYGPRYLLDALPMLVPAAALGLAWLSRSRVLRGVLAVLLIWSVAISFVGAFYYDADIWNWDDAGDVDRRPDRVWNWRDWQVRACLREGWHRDNFQLFDVSAFRRPGP